MAIKFTYEIQRHLGVLGQRGYKSLELNLIAYNGAKTSKYDLRRWLEVDGEKRMGKGITLEAAEVQALRELLNSMEGP